MLCIYPAPSSYQADITSVLVKSLGKGRCTYRSSKACEAQKPNVSGNGQTEMAGTLEVVCANLQHSSARAGRKLRCIAWEFYQHPWGHGVLCLDRLEGSSTLLCCLPDICAYQIEVSADHVAE